MKDILKKSSNNFVYNKIVSTFNLINNKTKHMKTVVEKKPNINLTDFRIQFAQKLFELRQEECHKDINQFMITCRYYMLLAGISWIDTDSCISLAHSYAAGTINDRGPLNCIMQKKVPSKAFETYIQENTTLRNLNVALLIFTTIGL